MNDLLLTFVESFVVPGLVAGGTALAVLKYLGQRFVDHRLGKDFERYKAELSEKSEALKTQLSIYSHEQTVEISRVDAQSAAAITNVYARMREVINPLSLIISGSPIVDGSDRQSIAHYLESAEAAHAAVGHLANTVADHAIYFDELTYNKVVQFSRTAGNPIALYLEALRKASAEGESDSTILRIAEGGRAALRSTFDEKISPLYKELVVIFRRSLGSGRR